MRRLATLGILVCNLTGAARAEQFWVAWEGNDFPENQGWQRRVNGEGPAVRTLADGIMTIDGLWSTQVDDFYRVERPLSPDSGEQFVMQWRLRVDEVIGNPLALYDPGVAVFSDDGWTVSLLFGTNFMRSFHEQVTIPIQSGLFHSVTFRSSDMRSYLLFVDDALVRVGVFSESFSPPGIDWGDRARGAASTSEWDYFRFGVVPEPGTCLLCLAPLLCARLFQVSRNTDPRRLRRFGRTTAGVRERDARAG